MLYRDLEAVDLGSKLLSIRIVAEIKRKFRPLISAQRSHLKRRLPIINDVCILETSFSTFLVGLISKSFVREIAQPNFSDNYAS